MKCSTTAFILSSAFSVALAMDFKPPTPAERLKAIGSTKGLSETMIKALDPGDDFAPVPVPKPGDWLAVHRETGQSFDDFVKSKPNRPDNIRNQIYLQPLGEFPEGRIPLVQTLREYAAAYFNMEVQVLASLRLDDSAITTRVNPFTGNRQILTGDVLAILKKNLPADAFCVLALTMTDLYPDPSWNFVFGQASLRQRVGVYSFARYDPVFYGQRRGKDYEQLLLRRSCKVLVHETGHMFGLMHCIYFRCVLNGSNHLQESDSRPLHLCPVCLRKLKYGIAGDRRGDKGDSGTKFDIVSRYAGLLRFYRKAGFDGDAEWVANRLEWILGPEKAGEITKRESER